jgi:hypothetical protein
VTLGIDTSILLLIYSRLLLINLDSGWVFSLGVRLLLWAHPLCLFLVVPFGGCGVFYLIRVFVLEFLWWCSFFFSLFICIIWVLLVLMTCFQISIFIFIYNIHLPLKKIYIIISMHWYFCFVWDVFYEKIKIKILANIIINF